MMIVDYLQGTPAWHAHRASHRNASDSPAVMGVSTKKTRSELLHERHTGLQREFSDYVQEHVIDPGYAYESQARLLAELIVGEPLYPVTGCKGLFSASFDGITMSETIPWEHKRMNAALRACMPEEGVPFDGQVQLPAMYCVQLEHQLMVCGGEKSLFMASEWEGDRLIEERHCWYYPDLALRAQIIAAWEQFEADLAVYVPPAAAPAAPVGKAPEMLPALRISVQGAVTDSNLAEFKATALAAIRGVNRELVTDQHFADADKSVKWCNDVESRLEAAKAHALSQTDSIEALFRTMDEIAAESKLVRLELTKLIDRRKIERKGEIVAGGIAALAAHIRGLNESLGKPYMPTIVADFAGELKGKRSFTSMQDAVDTELARAKIAANTAHVRVAANLKTLAAHADHAFLFFDESALVAKAPDDLGAVITNRIAEHDRKEAARIEAETQRIRAEEQARAQRDADARAKAEADAARAAASAAPTPVAAAIPGPVATPAPAAMPASTSPLAGIPRTPSPSLSGTTAPEQATLKLGTINERLAPASITAAGLEQLGFTPSAHAGASKLYLESQFPLICAALVDRFNRSAARDWRAAA